MNESIAAKAHKLLSKKLLSIGALSEATECKRRRRIRILTKDGHFQGEEKGVWSVVTPKEDGPKAFRRRESATAYLRKMGIAKDAYDQYIDQREEGFAIRPIVDLPQQILD